MTTENIGRTLVLLKPDAVQRGVMGKIIARLEQAGMKIVAAKLQVIDEEFARKHYFDVAERRGEDVLKVLLSFMTSGPIMALCVEGVDVAENVRRLIGATEPKSAAPGTIRGDYSHTSFAQSDSSGVAIQNLVHASGNADEATYEVGLWFEDKDFVSYKLAHEFQTLS